MGSDINTSRSVRTMRELSVVQRRASICGQHFKYIEVADNAFSGVVSKLARIYGGRGALFAEIASVPPNRIRLFRTPPC